MLVIPVSNKISWRRPPLATLGLILVNCFVFFVLQSGEEQAHRKALNYYFDSGLVDIEIRAYMDFIGDAGRETQNSPSPVKPTAEQVEKYYRQMRNDSVFLKKLQNDEIITPSHPEYNEWRAARNLYEKKLNQVFFLRYGFIPSSPKLVSAFSYMFLHGGFGHLLGNMIFLWLIGCMLEVACGRLFLITAYLITGLAAVGLYGLVYMDSAVPLVGASGAIAGFMGAFSVAFGRTRVRIFYSLGVYFNYLKIPALVLLPIWIGNELAQLFFTGVARVAYVAHIGGLLGGAVIGVLSLKFFKNVNLESFAEAPGDPTLPLIEAAMQRLADLDLAGSRRLLEKALALAPGNVNVLKHLFNVDKNDPEGGHIHETAQKLLTAVSEKAEEQSAAHAIYQEYAAIATVRLLPPSLYARLSTVFASCGHLDTAEELLNWLIAQKPDLHLIPPLLLKVSEAFKIAGDTGKWRSYRMQLHEKYPDTPEARIVKAAVTEASL